MAGKKTSGGKGLPSAAPKNTEVARMLIRNEIPAEEFLRAYGKYNYAKSAK